MDAQGYPCAGHSCYDEGNFHRSCSGCSLFYNTISENINYISETTSCNLNYGMIKKYHNMYLSFEPLTDTLDGFVLRDNKDDAIISVFPEKDKEVPLNG